MKIHQLIITLTFTLLALSSTLAIPKSTPMVYVECRLFDQLNEVMQTELQLTDKQLEALGTLNRKYWFSRNEILDKPNKTGKNTALLACWDKWQMELSTSLSQAQKERFMQWQSQVDLLGETPF